MTRSQEIINILKEFIEPKCELEFSNNYELIIAVLLSAQTTDKSVNKITKDLFKKYPNFERLSKADINDVKNHIRPIGLENNKSKSIINLSKAILNEFNGVIPNSLEDLMKLPGVGRKTASVVLALGFNIPALPVDTHVKRVATRLKMAPADSNERQVEESLKRKLPKKLWIDSHHYLLLFGRYYCKAINPSCENCKLKEYCKNR